MFLSRCIGGDCLVRVAFAAKNEFDLQRIPHAAAIGRQGAAICQNLWLDAEQGIVTNSRINQVENMYGQGGSVCLKSCRWFLKWVSVTVKLPSPSMTTICSRPHPASCRQEMSVDAWR